MTDEEKLAKLEESIAKLEAKNAELIGINKTAKQDAAEAKRLADEARDEAVKSAEEKALASSSVEEVRKTLEAKHKRELDKLTQDRDNATKQLQTLLVDNAIQTTLTTSNVAAPMLKPLAAMFKANEIKIADGVATVDGVPLTDMITEYLRGDEGKFYVTAPANSGGGATGAITKIVSMDKPPETAEEFEAYSKLTLSNPSAANAKAEAWGRPDLRPV